MRVTAALSFASIALTATVSAQTDQGGPDGFGYYFETNQDIGDTVTFSWIDPSGHPTLTDWHPNSDDGWTRIPLPFRLPLYGDTLDSVNVCTNGFLEFPVTSTSYANQMLPAYSFPYLVAPFWDDLSPAQSGSVRCYSDPDRLATIVTWLDVVRYNTTETLSAQAILHADGRIRFNILKAPECATSSTIGIQGHAGSYDRFLQYVWNGTPPRHTPANGTSIVFFARRLAHDVGVAHRNTPDNWVPAGSQCPVSATFKNYGTTTETFPVSARLIRTRYPFDTVFSRGLTVTDLAPSDTTDCYFGDWLISPTRDSWYALFVTDLSTDPFRYNDTCRAVVTSVPPPFGAILGSWDFVALGDGMNLAGITYSDDSSRFYVTAVYPDRVMSFAAGDRDVNLREEPFQLQSFFGDDMTWGIAWDEVNPGFWLTHVSAYGAGCVAARYNTDGAFSGDTWDLSGIEPGAWFAGLDMTPTGVCHAVEVGGGNRLYALDLARKEVLGYISGPPASYRACCFIGDHTCFLASGGWNQHALVRLDPAGVVLETTPLRDLADLDIYRRDPPCPDSLVWGFATTSSDLNTIHKVCLGRTWADVGLPASGTAAIPGSASLRVQPNPALNRIAISCGAGETGARITLWDATGRRVRSELVAGRRRFYWRLADDRGRRLPAGIYLLTLHTSLGNLTRKLVVARG